MSRIFIRRPDGSNIRHGIEGSFSYSLNDTLLEAAIREYELLLHTEILFRSRQPDKWQKINTRYAKHPQQNSYTDFGESLEKEYRESQLIKHIVACYKKRREKHLQDAMCEFMHLKEIETNYTMGSNFSTSVRHGGQKPSVIVTGNYAATYHGNERPQYVDTVSHVQGSADKKGLQDENERLRALVSKQGDDIKRLQKIEQDNDKTIDELRNRLSGIASKQLTEGNPNFTDLSDKNRPTKLAEKFHAVYDDEWTNSLEVLTKKDGLGDEESIYILMQLVKDIYSHCCGIATGQRTQMVSTLFNPAIIETGKITKPPESIPVHKELDRKIVNLQREYSVDALPNITKSFQTTNKRYISYQKYQEVVKYVSRCVEIIWLMRITDPPMVLKWPKKGDKFDTSLYTHYNNKGATVSYPVWPATLLHEGGAIINKGFVKPM